MAISELTPTTPLTGRADRHDERVRLIEESILLIRGDWPAVATGLCESVNRAAGLLFPTTRELDEAIETTSQESLRLVEQLYGCDAAAEVQRLAAPGASAVLSEPARPRRWRPVSAARRDRGARRDRRPATSPAPGGHR